MINIAICDDETVFAESLSVQVRNEIIQNNETCTEYICSNGTTLIELCQNESIDVAFVDISMPEMNGFEMLSFKLVGYEKIYCWYLFPETTDLFFSHTNTNRFGLFLNHKCNCLKL